MDNPEAFTIALPDVPEMEAVGTRLESHADLRVDHPSGRPWLLARTSATPTLVHDGETTQIALIGPTSATEDDLARIAATHIHDLRDIPEQTRRFKGNFLVLASTSEGLFGSGPIAQTRRVFYARIDGSIVLSDRADMLASLGEFPLDRTALAFRLIVAAPHPTSDLPLWSGVHTIAGSNYVVAPPRAAATTGTWWHRPSPELTRAEGACLLRDALADAVAVRTPAERSVASDLSGGLDSTPICYFAAQGPEGVLARTFYGDDPGGREDLEWAMRAMVNMPGVHTHDTFTLDGIPDFYGGLDEMLIPLDEPSQVALAAPRIEYMLRKDTEAGITIHLHGAGGDHLLRGLPMWNHTLARTRPVLAWTRSRSDDVTTDTPWVRTLRHLLDRTPYPTWAQAMLSQRSTDNPLAMMPGPQDWSTRPVVPNWISHDARDLIETFLRSAADQFAPLGPNRAAHADLFTIHDAGRVARAMGQVGQHHGINYDAPLLDDHVVQAVLSVRYEERDTPIEWKPLMKAAMRGLLPDDYLRRTNKIGGSPQAVRGYAKHYERLLSLWNGSGLLDTGLVDTDVLHRESQPSATSPPPNTLHLLSDAAVFLRNQAITSTAVGKGSS